MRIRILSGWFDGPLHEVLDNLRSSGAAGCTPVMHVCNDGNGGTLTHRHWIVVFGPADLRTLQWWEEGQPGQLPDWLPGSTLHVAAEPYNRSAHTWPVHTETDWNLLGHDETPHLGRVNAKLTLQTVPDLHCLKVFVDPKGRQQGSGCKDRARQRTRRNQAWAAAGQQSSGGGEEQPAEERQAEEAAWERQAEEAAESAGERQEDPKRPWWPRYPERGWKGQSQGCHSDPPWGCHSDPTWGWGSDSTSRREEDSKRPCEAEPAEAWKAEAAEPCKAEPEEWWGAPAAAGWGGWGEEKEEPAEAWKAAPAEMWGAGAAKGWSGWEEKEKPAEGREAEPKQQPWEWGPQQPWEWDPKRRWGWGPKRRWGWGPTWCWAPGPTRRREEESKGRPAEAWKAEAAEACKAEPAERWGAGAAEGWDGWQEKAKTAESWDGWEEWPKTAESWEVQPEAESEAVGDEPLPPWVEAHLCRLGSVTRALGALEARKKKRREAQASTASQNPAERW